VPPGGAGAPSGPPQVAARPNPLDAIPSKQVYQSAEDFFAYLTKTHPDMPMEQKVKLVEASQPLRDRLNNEVIGHMKMEAEADKAAKAAADASRAKYLAEHPELAKKGGSGDTVISKEGRRLQELEAAGQGQTTEAKALRGHIARMDRQPGAPGAARGASAILDKETLQMMAEQYLSGDKSVASGLGYGNVGASNRAALRKAINEEAKHRGMSGADIAAQLAEYQGIQAGERTAGVRSANIEMAVSEAFKMGDLVAEASANFDRTNFPPVNKALAALKAGTGDVAVRKFGASINSFINAYARAVAPAGVPTVSDKDHAREVLSTADTQEQVVGIIDQLQLEMAAARQAPPTVRAQLREAVTGKERAAGKSGAGAAAKDKDVPEYSSVAEAEKAGRKKGDRVKIGGELGTLQ
jgi:hypothetical protein